MVANRFPPLKVQVSRRALIKELAFMVTIEEALAKWISRFRSWVRVVGFRSRLDLLVVAWVLVSADGLSL